MPTLVNDERGSVWHDGIQLRSRRSRHPESGRQKSGAKQRVLVGVRASMLGNFLKHLLWAVVGADLDAIHQGQRVHAVNVGVDKTGQHRSTSELDDLSLWANLCPSGLALTQPGQSVAFESHRGIMRGCVIHRIDHTPS